MTTIDRFEICLLGSFEVRDGDGQAATPPMRKVRALLAILALHPGRHWARERLMALLWPESPTPRARASLRQALRLARRGLPASALLVGPDTVAVAPEMCWSDAAAVEAAARAGHGEDVAALYRGDFLADLSIGEAPFEDWCEDERRSLRTTAIAAMASTLTKLDRTGPPDRRIALARQLLALDPLEELVHRSLMRAYAEIGQRSQAVEQYRLCRAQLLRELGVPPEPETEAELAAILRLPEARSSPEQPMPAKSAAIDRPIVAVLPFVHPGNGPARPHLAAGLCEDMIACLAGWRLFPVSASTSTLVAGRESDNPVAAGRRVGARYVVAGTMRPEGRRVHLACRLIDCVDDLCLWADRFELAWDEVLAAHDDAARRIAACLHRELERSETRRIERKRPAEMTAWDYYAQGQHHLNRCSAAGNALARECYLRALGIDPEFADALTGLATSHNWDVMFGATDDRTASLEAARRNARRAVELDWTSSMAHLRLGGALTWLERLDEAMAETEIAVELDPSNAHARMALGNRLDLNGRPADGIAEMREGLRLNPIEPRAFTYMGFLARASLSIGDAAGALDWATRAAHARPDHPDVQYRLAICLAHVGRAREARAALDTCERLRPGFGASRATWRPYNDPDRNARVFAGLDRLGLRRPAPA